MSNREYLSFTKKERTGIIALLIIVLLVAIAPKYLLPDKREVINVPPEAIQQLRPAEKQYANRYPRDSFQSQANRFYKGSHDYPRRDYQKSSHQSWYKKEYDHGPEKNSSYLKAPAKRIVIEINLADTTDFIALPGIGSKLASRIVLFREKLGGFYSAEQVKEVYGLQDSVFAMILPMLKCDSSLIKKIEINQADKEVLKVHPYIRWNLANVLVEYRARHGPFTSPDDLSKITALDVEAIRKMKPYLNFR